MRHKAKLNKISATVKKTVGSAFWAINNTRKHENAAYEANNLSRRHPQNDVVTISHKSSFPLALSLSLSHSLTHRSPNLSPHPQPPPPYPPLLLQPMDRPATGPGVDMPIMHDSDRYDFVRDIGSGNFGVARLMRDKQTQELVAVKYIERGDKVSANQQKKIKVFDFFGVARRKRKEKK